MRLALPCLYYSLQAGTYYYYYFPCYHKGNIISTGFGLFHVVSWSRVRRLSVHWHCLCFAGAALAVPGIFGNVLLAFFFLS